MLPDVNDPDYWLQELEPLLKELDFALRVAVPKAHKFFTEYERKPINRPLLSNLVRYYTLGYLWANGYNAKEEGDGDPDSWGMRGLPNNGIELIFRQSCIRVRKGIEPPCPMTASSRDFYQQVLFDEAGTGIVTNLLVLFDLDGELQYDGNMRLVRPIKGTMKYVKCHWSRAVVLPAVDPTLTVPPVYAKPSELPLANSDVQQREPRTGTDDKNGD